MKKQAIIIILRSALLLDFGRLNNESTKKPIHGSKRNADGGRDMESGLQAIGAGRFRSDSSTSRLQCASHNSGRFVHFYVTASGP